MIRRFTCRRHIAAFVLAFLCLNAAGALCLGVCFGERTVLEASTSNLHLSEHCRQAAKQAEDRDKDRRKIEAGEAACCMLPIAMFAVPVEEQMRVDVVQAVATLPADHFKPIFAPAEAAFQGGFPVYRPPPLDRRVERVLNCVIRI
ncbi:MAG: hypothetical protein WBO10_01385 [Pyrinomonadaceae bacterium]